MKEQPSLGTARLVLRPLLLDDDVAVRDLFSNDKIHATAVHVLPRFGRKSARQWIGGRRECWAKRTAAEFAIELKSPGQIVGLVGFDFIEKEHASAMVSCVLDERCWGQGYATEATCAVISFGFRDLGLNRIWAQHLVGNVPAGRVLAKLGLRREGVLRELARKGTRFEDVAVMAVLRRDFEG